MAKFISILSFLLLTAGLKCGFSQSKLVFTGTFNDKFYPFDSLHIEDLSTTSRIVKNYPDTILKLLITDIDQPVGGNEFILSQNFPNPFNTETHFNIYMPEPDKLNITVFDLSGKTILNYNDHMPAGDHSFTFSGGEDQIYLLSAKTSIRSSAIKMLNSSGFSGALPALVYNGMKLNEIRTVKGKGEFEFNTGDDLVYTGYMTDRTGSVLTDTIYDSPKESKLYTFRFEKKFRIVILMYHKITDSVPLDEYERNTVEFENDLIYLRNKNYQILSMDDLPRIRSGELELISDAVIITFDDGYKSNYTKAFPLLTTYNMPATFFLTTEWIGTEDFMSWSEAWLMSEFINANNQRMFKMGSHTSSHPYLEQSAQNFGTHEAYLEFLRTELNDSKNWIVDVTGQPDIFISLPYGDGANNQDIINVAMESGYSGIRTSMWNSFNIEEMNLFALPSIPILYESSIDIIEDYFNR
jgi:peptidoglycan/xylan/chitin deacetylase (PgdA/CDA1 family)